MGEEEGGQQQQPDIINNLLPTAMAEIGKKL
jgi:hypothetical protein